MKNKIIVPILAFAFCAYFSASAQNIIRLNESIGRPLVSRDYIDVKGSPFFIKDWSTATVKLINGTIYKDLQLRYDEIADEPLFKNEQGMEMRFKMPVAEFDITYNLEGIAMKSHFKNGFDAIKGTLPSSYFEVLYDGTSKLLKKNAKFIQSYKAYNSATTTKTITDKVLYFISIDNKLKEFKRDKKGIQLIFTEKAEQLQKYISDNSLNLKNDQDLIKLVTYYDSLK